MPSSGAESFAPVRLAVVGAGTIGKKHLATIRAESGAALVGIVDPAVAAAAIAAEFATTLFPSISALMEGARPDGVVVATPTELHLQPTLEVLAGGAHVLVEKPITATTDEAAAVVASSHAAGRQVLVGHHRRYYPVLERAKEIIESDEIGRLVTVHGQWTLKKPDAYYAQDWRRRRAAGPVLTNLIHEIDTLRHVCGEIRSVSAEISNGVRGFAKEDAAALVMTFASGAIGTFILSDATPAPWAWELATGENPAFPPTFRNTHRFTGTKGALEFPTLALWRHVGAGDGWHDPMERHAVPFTSTDAFARQCAHFCAVIRGDERPRVSAADAACTLAATLAVFAAAELGRRVLP